MIFSNWMFRAGLLAALAVPGAMGQSVISAKAGVIHYTTGDVRVDAQTIETRSGGKFNDLKEGQELTTGEGLAEVLLNPGVFLRLGENSAVKMISNRLIDTRVELTSGTAIIEVAEASKDNTVTILMKDTSVTFEKMALVRLDVERGIRVYKGQAQVITGGTPQTLKDGKEFLLATNTVEKFDTKDSDALYRWANRRAESIAMANIASANTVRRSGTSFNSSGWYYNSLYGMMTYLPYGVNSLASPFGFAYYSPMGVYSYYQRYIPVVAAPPGAGAGGGFGAPTWNANNGYYNASRGAIMSGNAGASLPAASSAGVAPGGRGGSGGAVGHAGGAAGGGGGRAGGGGGRSR